MEAQRITHRPTIEAFLRRDPQLHFYGLADLDDDYWPKTEWFGLVEGRTLRAVCFLYRAFEIPALISVDEADPESAQTLLARLDLPRRFYGCVSQHLLPNLQERFTREDCGLHLKMTLSRGATRAYRASDPPIQVLSVDSAPQMRRLYEQAYQDVWFDEELLATGWFLGAFDRDTLIAVAGIHAFSAAYRVAALGNIATHPDYRRRGLGAHLTSALCQRLLERVDLIGLHVRADNVAAIKCYERVGFRQRHQYQESMFTRA